MRTSMILLSLAGLTGLALFGPALSARERGPKHTPVVNAKCPITGNEIDPEKVPPACRRNFDDKIIGFCCTGCPKKWDKLTDEEKKESLAKAMAPKPKAPPKNKPGCGGG